MVLSGGFPKESACNEGINCSLQALKSDFSKII